ncbi:hypothetical protein D3C76_709450 [compost metagenome]|uniref:hypothetical protein n=1 Tax=Pseudomonas putida TaxID=303 RepID=UPI000FC18F5F|nr:hypothetical protein [Pseudomonas putida]
MSETTEEKTKRKYLAAFRGTAWSHQYSVFYADPTLSHTLLDDMVTFKQRLRRAYPDQPFLIRVQLKSGSGRPLQAFLNMFTTKPADGLQSVAGNLFVSPVNVLSRKLSDKKLLTIAGAIERQRPQDLSKFFGKTGINRWSVLNKGLLAKPDNLSVSMAD